MSRRTISALFVICGFLAAATLAIAQSDPDTENDTTITRDQWLAKIRADQQRIEKMRREGKSMAPPDTIQDGNATQLSLNALQDDSLQPGDIVSTQRGLFRFVGKQGSLHTSADFVPFDR